MWCCGGLRRRSRTRCLRSPGILLPPRQRGGNGLQGPAATAEAAARAIVHRPMRGRHTMQFVSEGARLFAEQIGGGPDVVVLHPTPVDHTFWLPVARVL